MIPRKSLRGMVPDLVPSAVILGVLAGFGAMCCLGRQAARLDYHENFVRFTPWTAPDTKYYPTVNELMAIVRHEARPGQVLVIVGGNSVLLGVGQPPARIWTKRLQEKLGSRYCVLNFAFRGTTPNDMGAVAAEALRQEYPRQIYIANAPPLQRIDAAGSIVYRFMFWDAYHKGLLVNDPARAQEIEVNAEAADYAEGLRELRIRAWLDRWLYFQDLGNYLAYTKVSTVWDSYFPGVVGFQNPLQFTDPRRIFPDPEPDYLSISARARFPESSTAVELQNVRELSAAGFAKDADGKWAPVAPIWEKLRNDIATAFPESLRRRTLILIGHSSPFYVDRLTPDERERDGLACAQALNEWEQAGYASMAYGVNFTVDDYGDRTHLTWHGGQKLADAVAAKVSEMSQKLGYVRR
jgi:hypothetical protein